MYNYLFIENDWEKLQSCMSKNFYSKRINESVWWIVVIYIDYGISHTQCQKNIDGESEFLGHG